MSQPKHFLSLADIPASELRAILDEAHRRKRARAGMAKGKADRDAPFDGETIEDTAKVLSRFVDGIMLRANRHDTIVELARNSTVPVINGLTDYNHPCQIMADLQTLEEKGGQLSDMTLTWVGDGNNVAMSFVNAAAKFGFTLRLSTAEGYRMDGQSLSAARNAGGKIEVEPDPAKACLGTDVVIADCFVSMGDKDAEKRLADLAPYQVTDELMKQAAPGALFLHCLPAHRGEEVTAGVIDGPQSVVFDEAENRLHAQKAVICWCFDA